MEELVLIVWPGRRQKRMLTFLRDVDKHLECHSSEVACVYPWVQCVLAETSFKQLLGLPEYQCLREQTIALPSRAVLRTEASQKLHRSTVYSQGSVLPWQCRPHKHVSISEATYVPEKSPDQCGKSKARFLAILSFSLQMLFCQATLGLFSRQWLLFPRCQQLLGSDPLKTTKSWSRSTTCHFLSGNLLWQSAEKALKKSCNGLER